MYYCCLVSVCGVTGTKRRKVMRTTINDRGEEVTEEVWEEESHERLVKQQTEDEDCKSQPQTALANSPAGESPDKASQDEALKEQPGQRKCSGFGTDP